MSHAHNHSFGWRYVAPASDVFVGGTMGWFIGGYAYDTHMSHLAHKHASLVPIAVPEVQVATKTHGVTLLFAR